MNKIVLIILVLVLFMSCGLNNAIRESGNWGNSKEPVSSQKVGKGIVLDLLFEIPGEGVKVYRFVDNKHTRYVAVKTNRVSVFSIEEEKTGKNTTSASNSIETVY